MIRTDSLPRDAQSILKLAAQSLFKLFAGASEGMMLVDRQARVVWINDQYKRYLPALGFKREEDFVGHPVAQVVQNTQMHQVLESGKPILIDLLTNRAGTFVVSRIPLRDADGAVIGALGIVLFDRAKSTSQPLVEKFSLLQRDLDEAHKELATQRLRHAGQRQSKYTFASYIGMGSAALEVKRHARRAAQSSSSVLLLGETGTGKELLAHAIHAASDRAAGPFISINISAIPDALLEAEFFGVAPGAYTGATRSGRDGKFKLADGGTLFLDEIGDMPVAMQSKLLRALQEGEIEPLGSNTLVPFNARVIAATSRDLSALRREGRFREDLYYRLNVLPIRVPALRERREDIAALVEALGEDIALRNGTPPPELTSTALSLLKVQPWNGNIRELRNILEQAAMRSDAPIIDVATLEAVLRDCEIPPVDVPDSPLSAARPVMTSYAHSSSAAVLAQPLGDQVLSLERRAIELALVSHRGNKSATAKALGISRATLYNRLTAYDSKTV